MKRHVLIFGAVGGVLLVLLQAAEYRLVVVERSVEVYGGAVAVLFSALGVWLGLRIKRRREEVLPVNAEDEALTLPVASSLAVAEGLEAAERKTHGLTAREIEVLTLIARGLSNREIAAALFVSENTIKTHCARAFGKLGAARRTQAVQRGKQLGLLP